MKGKTRASRRGDVPRWEARFAPWARGLVQFQRAGVELIVGALEFEQVVVRAALDDAAVVQHHDGVGVAHGREAVGDDEHGAALHQGVHAALHDGLGARVDGRSGLVEDHHRRVGHGRAGDGQQLPLALAEVGAVALQLRIVALGQAADEVVCAGQLGGGDAFFIGGVQLAVAYVLHHRAGEEVGVLQNDAQRVAQIGLLDLVDVNTVVTDLAIVDIVEAVDEVGDGGLARAGGADEGQLLAGLGVEGDVVQNRLFRRVAEVDVEEAHVAHQASVGERAVVVGMLPRPHACALAALLDGAVFLLAGVDQRHIALVGLRLFIQQGKETVRARQAHDDHVHLVGYLADGAGELLGHVEEGHDDADAKGHAGDADVGDVRQHQRAADQGDDDVHDVADVAQKRHQHVGKAVAVAGVVEDLAVDLVKALLGPVLVTEDLDHLLAGHHLFHKGLGLGQRYLLAQEVLGGMAGDVARREGHAHHARHHDQAEDGAVIHHDAEDGQKRHAGDEHLRQALADHLAQGVDVVGVIAHDVAAAVGVEVADGQILHVVEHLFTHLLQRALRDDGHHLRIEEAGDEADHVHAHQNGHKAKDLAGNGGPVAALVGIVDDGDDVLHEDGRRGADDGVDEYTHQRHRQKHGIELKQRAQQAAQNALGRALAAGRGLARLGSGLFLILHPDHLPCSGSYRLRGRCRCS